MSVWYKEMESSRSCFLHLSTRAVIKRWSSWSKICTLGDGNWVRSMQLLCHRSNDTPSVLKKWLLNLDGEQKGEKTYQKLHILPKVPSNSSWPSQRSHEEIWHLQISFQNACTWYMQPYTLFLTSATQCLLTVSRRKLECWKMSWLIESQLLSLLHYFLSH